jgi:hypothetical protein
MRDVAECVPRYILLACSAHGGNEKANRILVVNPAGKRLLGRHGNRWENSIKIDVGKVVLEGVGVIHLAEHGSQWQSLVNTVMNFRVQ